MGLKAREEQAGIESPALACCGTSPPAHPFRSLITSPPCFRCTFPYALKYIPNVIA